METRTASYALTPRPAIHRYAVASVLLLRAVDHGLFAGWLISQRPGWLEIFRAGAVYAIVDGALGILVALLIMSLAAKASGRWLVLMTLVDGVGRLGVGIALRVYPGIPTFVVTIVSFFGLVGAAATGAGVAAMTVWVLLRIRERTRWSLRADSLFDPLAVAAMLSFVVGYILFVDPPTSSRGLLRLGTAASSGMALVFAAASVGALAYFPHRARPEASPFVP